MVAVLRQLQGMGVRIAIDDFGTGYSSLSYLKQFRVNKLKIDRSLIRDVVVNSDDASITTAIIGMGKNLNLTVIAEGVENEEQLSFLRERQCDQIQGYLFSRPISSCETSKLLLHEQAIRDRHEGLCLSFSDCSSAFVLTGAGHNVGDPSLTSQTPEEDLSTLISGSRSIQ
jgi:EAL domain-containing protein (putative c-di-GMP-specific phosphodiesterase class I)